MVSLTDSILTSNETSQAPVISITELTCNERSQVSVVSTESTSNEESQAPVFSNVKSMKGIMKESRNCGLHKINR